MNVDELGIDSLVAVDIRSWFIKELSVDMPVLKNLGGFTVTELVVTAQEKVPEALVPNLSKELDAALNAAARTKISQPVPAAEKKAVANDNNFEEFEEGEEGAMEE